MHKIIGGQSSTYGSHPWMARVMVLVRDRAYHLCGGTIIADRWILTAAHCFAFEKNNIIVKVGDHNLVTRDDHEQVFVVDKIFIHETASSTKPSKTDQKSTKTLKKPETTKLRPFIQFNHYVQPACLPSASTTYEAGMKCEVTGWGLIDEDSLTPPNSLHSAILPIINETECKRLYKDLFKLFVTEDSFCAGYATGEVDTCSGDSGGPLICNIDGVHTLMGVTSRGNGCANKNSPGIYAKVANFISWIEETISKYDHF
ncbi:hypothetical protein HELRODRAFT_97488 [Helobdella robusta]|uniref:Peptidase S1 domain-containing protein n=1 Tax=Helobdella robusta TaxID=6412 RepID=T1G9H3_HELRO|nr:hypothetical protein HELRODRAFT_97488 [Helobdella robusta]ESO09319.1 hypothetical protein HELRODRAFT_97488 [Helobdella robusta]